MSSSSTSGSGSGSGRGRAGGQETQVQTLQRELAQTKTALLRSKLEAQRRQSECAVLRARVEAAEKYEWKNSSDSIDLQAEPATLDDAKALLRTLRHTLALERKQMAEMIRLLDEIESVEQSKRKKRRPSSASSVASSAGSVTVKQQQNKAAKKDLVDSMYHMETNADILQNCVAPAAEEEEIIELNHSTAILVNSPIHTDPSHTMAQPSHSVIPRYQHPSLLNNQPKPQQHQHQHQPHHIPFQGPSVHQSVQPFPAPRNSYPFHMPAPMLPFPTPSMPNPAATIDKQASGTQNPIPSQAHPHDDDATLRPPGIDAETFPHMTLPPAPAPHFVTPAGTEPSPPPRENTPLAPRTPPSARPAGTGPVRVLRAAAAMEEFTRSMAPTPEARVPTPRRDRSGGRGCEEEERGNIEGRQSAATPSRSRVGMREVFDGQGREDAAILADVVEPVRKSMRKEATDMKVTATLTRVCADHEDGRCVCKNGTLAVKSIGGGKGSGRIVIYDDDTDEKVLNLRLDECVKVVTSESFNVRLCVVKPDHELEDTVSDDASKQKTGQVVRVIYVIQVPSEPVARELMNNIKTLL